MRRFIAGAVCPECRAVDRIVVEEHEGVRRRRCVSCGFAEALDSESRGAGSEPVTRFTRPAGRDEVPVRPVRIVDPPKRDPR